MSNGVNLTPKQEAFIAQYLETGNATEAYRRVYDAENMGEATINVKACELLKNGKVAVRLRELQERAAKKVVLTRSFVLEGLMKNAAAAALKDDFTASNKAYELLGKVDELSMFVERSNVISDNRHTHSAEAVPPLVEFARGLVAKHDQDTAQGTLPN